MAENVQENHRLEKIELLSYTREVKALRWIETLHCLQAPRTPSRLWLTAPPTAVRKKTAFLKAASMLTARLRSLRVLRDRLCCWGPEADTTRTQMDTLSTRPRVNHSLGRATVLTREWPKLFLNFIWAAQ